MKVLGLTAKLVSINERYMVIGCKCKKARLALSGKYRKCKDDLARCMTGFVKDANIVTIKLSTYKDIDALIKLTLDALETKGLVDNDRQITELHIYKTAIKRGSEDKIEVWLDNTM